MLASTGRTKQEENAMLDCAQLITKDVYKSVRRGCERLRTAASWRGQREEPDDSVNTKEAKVALEVFIFACLKSIMLPDDIDLTAFPAFILKRIYRKACSGDIKPYNSQYFRSKAHDFDEKMEAYTYHMMVEYGLGEFADMIWAEAAKLPAEAKEVFDASKALATLVEYERICDKLRFDIAEETRQRVYTTLEDYMHLPHFSEIVGSLGTYSELKDLFRITSCCRYIWRWQGYISTVKCSILDHMLESALFAYLANIELGRETDIIQDFWCMMFHDLPEVWTDDVSGPIKDKLLFRNHQTWRMIIEEHDKAILDAKFYPMLPPECKAFFRNGVMLDDVKDPERYLFYKNADYFSADIELYLEVKGGSHELRFRKIMIDSTGRLVDIDTYLIETVQSKNRTPAQRALLIEMLENFGIHGDIKPALKVVDIFASLCEREGVIPPEEKDEFKKGVELLKYIVEHPRIPWLE